MRQRVTREVYAYWSRLKGARSAPERADVDISALPFLADTFLIEIDLEGAFPISVSGRTLNALRLSEQKGTSFLDLWRKDDRPSVAAAILAVIDDAVPVIAGVRSGFLQFEPLDLELLFLPMRHFGKTHSRVLGSLAPVGRPWWFGLEASHPFLLTSLRMVKEADRNLSLLDGGEPPEKRRTSPPRPRLVLHRGGE